MPPRAASRTTNRVLWVQQVIIKYIQDLTALVRLVQLVRGHERAGSGGTAGTPGLRASTGAQRHLGQTLAGPWPFQGNIVLDLPNKLPPQDMGIRYQAADT